jgi:two-component system sensor histidine kinase AtoS
MEDNSFMKGVFVSLFVFLGLMAGIALVPAVEGRGIQYVLYIAVVLAIAALIMALRIYVMRRRKVLRSPEQQKQDTEVGFVVETFHDLVAKLKEKEIELKKLKALAEEKATSMEAYNENILQSVPSGVISVDNSMTIKSINQAAEKILGLNSGNVIEVNFNGIFNAPLLTLISGHENVVRGEYQYTTKDNRNIWLGISTSQLKNAAGEKIGHIFVFTDLTDIKALQARMELKERLSQLGEMSAGISHELRNSMSVISGYAKLLSKKVEEPNKHAVDEILLEIRTMDKIISELLAFAKPSVLSVEQVDLHELVDETIKYAVVDNDRVSLSVDVDVESPAKVNADAVLMKQALTNILINASEAMPKGGTISIRIRRLNNRVKMYIEDSGPGIPEDIREKIFLPFYTTKAEGIGLGLALVQKIIFAHGGTIEVGSNQGGGTSFSITLPVKD